MADFGSFLRKKEAERSSIPSGSEYGYPPIDHHMEQGEDIHFNNGKPQCSEPLIGNDSVYASYGGGDYYQTLETADSEYKFNSAPRGGGFNREGWNNRRGHGPGLSGNLNENPRRFTEHRRMDDVIEQDITHKENPDFRTMRAEKQPRSILKSRGTAPSTNTAASLNKIGTSSPSTSASGTSTKSANESRSQLGSTTGANRGLAETLKALAQSPDVIDNEAPRISTSTKSTNESRTQLGSSTGANRGLAETLKALAQPSDVIDNEAPAIVIKKEKEDSVPKNHMSQRRSIADTLRHMSEVDHRKTPPKESEKETTEEEDIEKSNAIKQLPENHQRGLMSTLINIAGAEVVNREPDPLPAPRPMKLKGMDAPQHEQNDDDKTYDEEEEECEFNGFYCYLCQVETTSMQNFRDHLNGKSHKSTFTKLKSSMSKRELNELLHQYDDSYTEQDVREYVHNGITRVMLQESGIDGSLHDDVLPKSVGKSSADPEFYCSLCKVQTTSLGNFRDHLNGRNHKNMLTKAKDGLITEAPAKSKKAAPSTLPAVPGTSVILEMLVDAKEPILGLSFITEYHSSGRVVCVCSICAAKFDSNAALSHTTGKKHRLSYMREKQPIHYDHCKRFGGKKSHLASFLEEICPDVEKSDGRGTPVVKIFEIEDFDTGAENVAQEEEKYRQMVDALPGHKQSFDAWVTGAVDKAQQDVEALGNILEDDWDTRSMRSTSLKPVKNMDTEKSDVERILDSLKSSNERDWDMPLSKQDELYRGERVLPSRGYSPPRRGYSPQRRGYSPPRRGHSPPRRRHSPPRRGHSPPRRGHSPPRRGHSPPRRGHSPPRRFYSPSRRDSPPPPRFENMGRSYPPHREYRPPYDEPFIPPRPPVFDPPGAYPQPFYSDPSRRYISLPTNLDPDPLKRSDRYISVASDLDPDPLKRLNKEILDYGHSTSSRDKALLSDKKKSSVQTKADEWDQDIQDILNENPQTENCLSKIKSAYSSSEGSLSPPPHQRVKSLEKVKQIDNKKLPFSKSYLEIEKNKSKKNRQSRSPDRRKFDYDKKGLFQKTKSPPRKRRSLSRSPSFQRSKRRTSRSPDRRRVRRSQSRSPGQRSPMRGRKTRSPDTSKRLRSRSPNQFEPQKKVNPPVRLPQRGNVLKKLDSIEIPSPERFQSSGTGFHKHKMFEEAHRLQSPPKEPPQEKDDIAAKLREDDDEDAQAEAIANKLLQMSSSFGGQAMNPHDALQLLISNPEVAQALLSGKSIENTSEKSKSSSQGPSSSRDSANKSYQSSSKVKKAAHREKVAFGLKSGRSIQHKLPSDFAREDSDMELDD